MVSKHFLFPKTLSMLIVFLLSSFSYAKSDYAYSHPPHLLEKAERIKSTIRKRADNNIIALRRSHDPATEMPKEYYEEVQRSQQCSFVQTIHDLLKQKGEACKQTLYNANIEGNCIMVGGEITNMLETHKKEKESLAKVDLKELSEDEFINHYEKFVDLETRLGYNFSVDAQKKNFQCAQKTAHALTMGGCYQINSDVLTREIEIASSTQCKPGSIDDALIYYHDFMNAGDSPLRAIDYIKKIHYTNRENFGKLGVLLKEVNAYVLALKPRAKALKEIRRKLASEQKMAEGTDKQ